MIFVYDYEYCLKFTKEKKNENIVPQKKNLDWKKGDLRLIFFIFFINNVPKEGSAKTYKLSLEQRKSACKGKQCD